MAHTKTFSDYLNWGALVSPGVVVCKDGSLLAGWSVQGLDTESIAPEVLDAHLEMLGRGIARFSDEDAFWVSFRRRGFDGVERDPTQSLPLALELMETERDTILNHDGTLYRNAIELVYQYSPLSKDTPIKEALVEFEARCSKVAARLGSVVGLTRLAEKTVVGLDGDTIHFDELSGFLAQSISGVHRKIRIPEFVEHMYLDVLLKVGYSQPDLNEPALINDRPVITISIDDFPNVAPRGALAALEQLDLEYQWTTRYVCFSKTTSKKRLKGKRKAWKQAAASPAAQLADGGGGERDPFAEQMALNIKDAEFEVGSGDVGFGNYTSTINIFAGPSDSLETVLQGARVIEEILFAAGFEARLERHNAFEAFLGSLPGHRHRNPGDVIVTSQNFADLIPIRTIWQGEPYNPSDLFPNKSPPLLLGRSQSGEIYNLNLHHDDVGHSIIFGPTGAGKSVLLGLLAANFLKYPSAQVIAFDKKRSMQFATYALGGSFTAFGGAQAHGIAPMSDINELGPQWAAQWLVAFANAHDIPVSPEIFEDIHNTVKLLQKSGTASLKAVHSGLHKDDLKLVLGNYFNGILDAKADEFQWSNMTVFETQELFEAGDAITMLALDYVFAKIEKRFDGRPTLLIIDEAWYFLQHPIFVERIRSWLKEGRRSNVTVVLATQSSSDAANSDIMPVLRESCPTKIFLGNPAAKIEETAAEYKTLGINDAQIDLISRITPKKEYYVVQPNGQRVVDFLLGSVALSILGKTSKSQSTRAGELYATDPDFWLKDVSKTIEEEFITETSNA